MPTYLTWYEFKKDLERQVGHFVVNSDWLKIKPREPLPWNDASMKSALDGLAEMKRVGRKPGSYVLTNRIK